MLCFDVLENNFRQSNVTYAIVASMLPISSLPPVMVCGAVDRGRMAESDDDTFNFSMRGLPRPASWLGSHTESAVAAMAGVRAADQIKKQFAHLEEHYGKGTTVAPLETQQSSSLPRACVLYPKETTQATVEVTNGLSKCSMKEVGKQYMTNLCR
ncbi:hypothetical protein Tco_0669280 [Tanacetum coccineum]